VKAQRYEQCFGGTSVRYFVYTPRGEVLRRAAFIGSMLGDARCWDWLCRKLCASGVLCVVMELPGFGTTPVRAPQDNITRSRIFWGVLDDVEMSRGEDECSWHLIAHGSACGVILEMARSQSSSVISRTLISPVTDKFMDKITGLLPTTGFGKWLIKTYYGFFTGNRRRFEKKVTALYGQKLPEKRMDMLHKEFVRRGRVHTITEMFANGYSITQKAYKAQGRIMLIWGKQDKIFGANPPGKLIKELPEIELHLLSCAHMAMETNWEEVGDYLDGWFQYTEGKMKQPVRTDKL